MKRLMLVAALLVGPALANSSQRRSIYTVECVWYWRFWFGHSVLYRRDDRPR